MVSCFVADDPETVFLVAMWVAADQRGTGVARELVERVVAWAGAHGAARVALSVEPGNDRAARLYEKCGFVETDDPPPFPYEPRPDNRFYVLEF
jgi:GNAT superfamily N-acetyltransferase